MNCHATTTLLWFAPSDKPKDGSRLLLWSKDLGVEIGIFTGNKFVNAYNTELKDEWVGLWAHWPEEPVE